jgi:DNA-binding CsgD family transcriptional regulator
MFGSDPMTWLADTDVAAVNAFARMSGELRTEAELRRQALQALADLVPSDVLTWDWVELATGAVDHEAVPSEAEPPCAFAEPRSLSHSELDGDVLHRSGIEYSIAIGIRAERREAVVAGLGRTEYQFSERDTDVLDLMRPALEEALQAAKARGRLFRALAATAPPDTGFVLLDSYGEIVHSSADGERWLAEHFGPAEHPGWLPGPVAEWLALPPRPALVSVRDGRRLTVRLLPGDPHALLLEEEVARFRPEALEHLGLTPRETEVLRVATAIEDEADIAWELFLSLHAVRQRLARLETKLGAHSAGEAIARALRASV